MKTKCDICGLKTLHVLHKCLGGKSKLNKNHPSYKGIYENKSRSIKSISSNS